jgi:hypothetical protein
MSTTARTMQITGITAIVAIGLLSSSTTALAAPPRAGTQPHAAAGHGLKCAKTATIVRRHGTGKVVVYGVKHPSGDTFTGKIVKRHNVYRLQGKRITLRFDSNHYSLSNGTIFKLGCSGDAVGDPATMPSLDVLRGTIRVRTTLARHGSVFTEEALFGPAPADHHRMRYTVTRTTKKKHVSVRAMQKWFAGYRDQPTGTSRGATTSKPKLNVTPYVGPNHGTCRVVQSAKLVTKRSYGHGTAAYHF